MYAHNNDKTRRYRRHRESLRAGHILYAPLQRSETPPDSYSSAAEDARELTEDEIFSTGDFRRNGNKTFSPPENSGILAALPTESEVPNVKINSRRLSGAAAASVSSSSSSARMIPLVPRPPKRLLSQESVKFPQSAPVNVPVWPRRDWGEVGSEGEEENEQEEERLPPHEILARRESPWVACSVLEGSGRTLKGRDLRQVRNAVWRKTGFLD